MAKKFVFTPENLIKNIHRLGGWSAYGLAEIAIKHFHPECKRKTWLTRLNYMAGLKCDGKDPTYWKDWIVKYHKEVGYKELNPEVVNQF